MTTDNLQSTSEPLFSGKFGYQLETRRWFILIAYSLYSASTAMAWLTYDSTSTLSMKYFNIDETQLLGSSDAGLYMSFFLSYIGCFLVNKSFKKTLLISFAMVAIGGWIRYFGGNNYTLVLVGQFTYSLFSVMVFGFATIIPDRWFASQERFFATTFALYANYTGWAVGLILPCLITDGDDTKIPESTMIQAIIMTVPILIGIFCVEERPKIAPSYSALVKQGDQLTFWEEMNRLFKVPRFIWTSIFFGLALGMSYSISTITDIFVDNLNLTPIQAGLVGFSYVASGLVAGFIGTMWLSRSKNPNYDVIIRIMLSMSLLALTVLGVVFLLLENPDSTLR